MTFVREGVISLYSFVTSVSLPFCVLPVCIYKISTTSRLYSCAIAIGSSSAFHNLIYLCFKDATTRQVARRASFLGTVFSAGICLSVFGGTTLSVFGWYTCILSFFHFSEYLTIAVTNPKSLSIDSFMLDHSLAYKLAAVASWAEFFVEHYFFPNLKSYVYVSIVGIVLCVAGECLRKLAMYTASTNFNHIVQTVKEKDHVLITHGVYGLCRHPSYVGWFYWSIGTQLILVNPLCVVVYTMASWTFFKNRLLVEEEMLTDFFGEEYVEYKKRVHSGLPFNDGISLET